MTDDYVTWSLDDLSGVLDDYGLDYTVNFEDYDVYDRMLSRETERKRHASGMHAQGAQGICP